MHTFEVATSSASNKRVLHVPSKQEVPVTREICLKPKVFENDSLKEVETNRALSNSLIKPGKPQFLAQTSPKDISSKKFRSGLI